jgi:hypothetical protein
MHVNTIDLRLPDDANTWINEAPDLVNQFIMKGGYRLRPISIYFPTNKSSDKIVVKHSWENTGVGKLPNDRRNWDNKYKVAFAFLDPKSKAVVHRWVDDKTDPSWLNGKKYTYSTEIDISTINNGQYLFAVAIVDTKKGSRPGLHLAVNSPKVNEGIYEWYPFGFVNLTREK